MNFVGLALLALAFTFYETDVEATVCKPFSVFKIDCDECECSEDGTQYSCTIKKCEPTSFLDSDDEDSYVLADNIFKSAARNSKLEIPYINDEIPPSNEKTNNEFSEDYGGIGNDIQDDNVEAEKNIGEALENVNVDNQDGYFFDNGLPDDSRLRRYIKQGKRYIHPAVRRL